MTQINQVEQVPKTNVMVWYAAQKDKMNAIRCIRSKMKEPCSAGLITNWLLGYSEPKKENQLIALEQVTGMSRDNLFEVADGHNG